MKIRKHIQLDIDEFLAQAEKADAEQAIEELEARALQRQQQAGAKYAEQKTERLMDAGLPGLQHQMPARDGGRREQ